MWLSLQGSAYPALIKHSFMLIDSPVRLHSLASLTRNTPKTIEYTYKREWLVKVQHWVLTQNKNYFVTNCRETNNNLNKQCPLLSPEINKLDHFAEECLGVLCPSSVWTHFGRGRYLTKFALKSLQMWKVYTHITHWVLLQNVCFISYFRAILQGKRNALLEFIIPELVFSTDPL